MSLLLHYCLYKMFFIPTYLFSQFSREARIALIKIHTKDSRLTLTSQDWNVLADKTDGYSGSDIANMTLGALFGPIRDIRAAQFWCRNTGNKSGINNFFVEWVKFMLF